MAARIPQEKLQIALLGDGAERLWNAMTKCFPEAREVLDYYHCAEHAHKVAKLQSGNSLAAQQWAKATITRLFLDQTGTAIGGFKRMQPSGAEAWREIKKADQLFDESQAPSRIPGVQGRRTSDW